MKTNRIPILLAALLLLPTLSSAQTTAVPGFISYQGEVLDGTGNPVGVGTPVNRTVTFRIWDHPSNILQANLFYSEQQTVTIADGQFSVLVGQGVGTVGSQFGYSETSKGPQGSPVIKIADAFGASVRYLGVTVDDGTAAVDNEITPRQQIVTSAFAFRAKEAETVITNAIGTGNLADSSVTLSKLASASVNSGSIVDSSIATADLANNSVTLTKMANNSVDSSKIVDGSITSNDIANGTIALADLAGNSVDGSKIVDGSITTADLAGNSVDGGKIVDGSITTADLANTSVTAAKLGADVGAWAVNGANISRNSNVGIGTATPGFPLTFPNAVGDKISLWGQSGVHYGFGIQNSLLQIHTDSGAGDVAFGYGTSAAMTETMRIKGNGNVGIGTNNPTQAKLVVNGTAGTNYYNTSWGQYGTGGFYGDPNFASPASIYASGYIVGERVMVFSDARIKSVEGVSDSARDLQTLLGIEVTDYRYKDIVAKGGAIHKKVIAQQVEKAYPQAVSARTDVVADIYQKAAIEDGWVRLATDLKKGDRVKIISERGEGIHEVLEVGPDKFRTDFKPESDQVFVYGREVDDFRTVDYDAIAMLNVSATQELARQVERQKQENSELKVRLAALEADASARDKELAALKARDAARDAKLVAIEKLLLAADPSAPRTVSLKTSAGTAE